MAITETGYKGFSEKIELKQVADVVTLTTTATQKEVFLNVIEALEKKEAESRSNKATAFGLRVLGIVGIAAGAEIFTTNLNFSNKADILRAIGGLSLMAAGTQVFCLGENRKNRASLISRQLNKIKYPIFWE